MWTDGIKQTYSLKASFWGLFSTNFSSLIQWRLLVEIQTLEAQNLDSLFENWTENGQMSHMLYPYIQNSNCKLSSIQKVFKI